MSNDQAKILSKEKEQGWRNAKLDIRGILGHGWEKRNIHEKNR